MQCLILGVFVQGRVDFGAQTGCIAMDRKTPLGNCAQLPVRRLNGSCSIVR